jgi:arginase
MYLGKDLADPRVLTDVGDVPIQEMRDSGIGDELLMKAISDSVKLVMNEVRQEYHRKFNFPFCTCI